MINWIVSIFNSTLRAVRRAKKAVDAFLGKYADLYNFGVYVVQELESVEMENDEKKAEAFRRIKERAETIDQFVRARHINFIIELGLIISDLLKSDD